MRKCSICKEYKALDSFYFSKYKSINLGTENGVYSSACKECGKKKRQGIIPKYVKKDRTRIIKNSWLKKSYGISIEDYEEMVEKQNGVCAICFKSNKKGKRLFVDHNHNTGKVRKLLCVNCNNVLGLVYENVNILDSMIRYLQNHELK